MKKTKILGIVLLAIFGLFTLTACGNKEGVVNYTNYTGIVVTDPLDTTIIPSTYIDVTNTLVGPATDTSLF
ncbi:MAG: hypothetical protein PHQ30_03835, partial [Candidatus Izemoplasmatales bacterium]|nr:hypothetical protein [Candidatus Izemoplasmatales bacterium]